MTTLVLTVIVILVCVFCAGLIAEALRIAPKTPEQLYWAPEIPIRYVDIDGNRIRYIKTGSGPNLVTRFGLSLSTIPRRARRTWRNGDGRA